MSNVSGMFAKELNVAPNMYGSNIQRIGINDDILRHLRNNRHHHRLNLRKRSHLCCHWRILQTEWRNHCYSCEWY